LQLVLERGEFRPHVLVAPKGGQLELRTTEKLADFQASGPATFSATLKAGDKRRFSLSSPGLIEVRSQLQPSRTAAYVWVLNDSHGTLTGSDGRFRLPKVSPGKHNLVLWHEDWREQEPATSHKKQVTIELEPDEGAEVIWTLGP
jgi:hypothetical protein